MADEIIAAPVAVAATTPPAPVAAPVIDSPAPVQAPPAAVAPPAAAPPAAPEAPSSPAPEVKPTSLLGAEPAKEAPAAPEAAKAAEGETPKADETPKPVEPAALPSFEAFTLAEGATFDDARLGEFTKELGEFEVLTKADHAEMQKFGQKLVDRHVAEIQSTVQRLNEYYQNAALEMRNKWKESFEKDPEIGGNRADTTIGSALQFIRTHGGDETQQKEFRELMDSTGVGNHPALIRILAKANAVLGEGKPLPGTKPMPQPQSKVSRRYGGN